MARPARSGAMVLVWTFLQIIAATSEASQTSLMAANAEMITYADNASEMVCLTFHVTYCN